METSESQGMEHVGRSMVTTGFAVLPGEERLSATPMDDNSAANSNRNKTSILLAALNSPPGSSSLANLTNGSGNPLHLIHHHHHHHASSMAHHAATPPASPPESLAGDSSPASPESAGPVSSPPPPMMILGGGGTRSPSPSTPTTAVFAPAFLNVAASIPTPLTSPRGESAAAAVERETSNSSVVPMAVHPPDSARLGSTIFRPSISHAVPNKPDDALLNPTGHRGVKVLGGKYLLVERDEGNNMHRCIDVHTSKEYSLKTIETNDPSQQSMLAAHYRVDGHANINPVHEVVIGSDRTYLIFPTSTTDLHSYVRTRRRLKEPQARHLFAQIVSAVHEAHLKGIVLRDLKLRKFVFTSESRMDLRLESLEDAVVLEDESDDLLSDKHGCPAYVSPEILRCNTRYSGRAADMWGLGVMLYTMMVGRYPFHGQEHSGLFAKIRRGQFTLPDSLSSRAKCLIRCLLRKDPDERLSTEDVLLHPWLTQLSAREKATATASLCASSSSARRALQEYGLDQTVPEAPSKAKEAKKAGPGAGKC